MTRLTNVLAIASTSLLLATSSAFAGPDIGPENEVQYQVSSHETLFPQSPARPAARAVMPMVRQAAPAASFDPHWGPSFDPSVN